MSEEDNYPIEFQGDQDSEGELERELLDLDQEPIYEPSQEDLDHLKKRNFNDPENLEEDYDYYKMLSFEGIFNPVENDFSDLTPGRWGEDDAAYITLLEQTLDDQDRVNGNIELRERVKQLMALSRSKTMEINSMRLRHTTDIGLGRRPPQDTNAEQIVLGMLFKYPELRDKFSQPYLNKMLFSLDHANVHKVMMKQGKRADISSVAHELRKNHQLEPMGGEGILETFVALAEHANPENIEHYLNQIEGTYLARSVIQHINASGEMFWSYGTGSKPITRKGAPQSEDQNGTKTIVELIRGFNKGLLEVLPYRYQKHTSPSSLMKIISDEFEDLKSRGGKPEVSTGYQALDRVTHGIRGNKLIVLGARTKQGKTTLETNLAKNVAEQGKHVLFFTYENSPGEIIKKLWANYAGVDSEIFDYYEELTKNDEEALERARETVKKLPITIESGTPDIDYIQQRTSYLKLDDPSLSLVIVDGLQSFAGHVPYQGNKTDIYYEILKKLKNIAGEQRVSVIVSSQLKQDVEKRKNKKPGRTDDFSDCKGLAEVADTAFVLYRPEFYWPDEDKYKGKMSVIPVAMRSGEVRDKQFQLGCDMKTSRIYELEKKDAYKTKTSKDKTKE